MPGIRIETPPPSRRQSMAHAMELAVALVEQVGARAAKRLIKIVEQDQQ